MDGWMDAAMETGSEPSGDDGGILLTGTFFPALAHPSSSRRQRVGRGPRVWMGVHEGGMGGWGSSEAGAQPWDHPQAGVPHAQERPPCPQLSPRFGLCSLAWRFTHLIQGKSSGAFPGVQEFPGCWSHSLSALSSQAGLVVISPRGVPNQRGFNLFISGKAE